MKSDSSMIIKLSTMVVALAITGCAQEPRQTNVIIQEQNISPELVWVPLESVSSPTIGRDFTYIDGKPYTVNKSGEILINQLELENIKKGKSAIYQPQSVAGIDLTERELQTLMQDQDALFIYLQNPTLQAVGPVSFAVLKGSLEDNLTRLVGKSNIDSVSFETSYDYHVPEDTIISANSFEELLTIFLLGFPVESTLEESDLGSTLRVYNVGDEDLHFGFTAEKGSLKNNIFRLSKQAGVKPVWDFEYDYMVEKTTLLRGESYEDLMVKLISLKGYPIKAEVNASNTNNQEGK